MQALNSTEKKRRNAGETRARLLESARFLFTQKGYEGVGLREICGNAGVDQSLVKRYFGSKLQLFNECFDTGLGMHEILSGSKENLGREVADYYINKPKVSDGFDATMALLRSIGGDEAVNLQLREMIETQFITRLADLIGGQNAEQRAAFIISQIVGFDVLRRVLGVEAMSDEHKTKIRNGWARQIQALIDEEG